MGNRILVAGFKHETNTFSILPTGLPAFRARALYQDDEVRKMLRGTRTEIAAFLSACDRYGWSAVCPVFAEATPSGKVEREAFDFVTGRILEALVDSGPFDAILLSLHGAMVCEHGDDGEGMLLEAIRDEAGRSIPIAATLDLHANVTDRMADLADILVSYRTYPHVDMYETGVAAARLIQRTLEGEIAPRTFVARGAMLDGADHGRSTSPGPMTELLDIADGFGSEPGVLAVGINGGFPWADIFDAGPSAVVVGDGGNPRYRDIAGTLVEEIWQRRHRTILATLSAEQAMDAVAGAGLVDKPIVIADFTDNPGGGGYGDSTNLLSAMLQAGLQNAAFAGICDPASAQSCAQAGPGGVVDLELGGKIDARFGAPLTTSAVVVSVTDGRFTIDGPMFAGVTVDLGVTAHIKVGGIDVVVTSQRLQAFDLQYFRQVGIDPVGKTVLAVKSAHHFRAAFEPIASRVIVVDTGMGLTSRNYREFSYKHVRRPVYPLDLD